MAQANLSAEEIVRLSKQYTIFEWSAQAAVHPIPMSRAEGIFFWDANGKRYFDFNSQLMSVNIGHGNKRVIEAIKKQAEALAYANPYMATEVRGMLGKKLAELAPGDLNKSFFTLGGAEANENAIKIARMVTGRNKIIARYRSYHGGTAGAATLTGDPRRWAAEPGIPGVVRVLDPYQYRCGFCSTSPTGCNQGCLRHVEDVVEFEDIGRVPDGESRTLPRTHRGGSRGTGRVREAIPQEESGGRRGRGHRGGPLDARAGAASLGACPSPPPSPPSLPTTRSSPRT